MPTAATTTQATLPPGIEVFRAGARTADNGQTYTITPADIAAAAAAYDPALHEAPLTVGHPAHNLPAYGWVTGLRADGDVLRIDSYGQVEPQFAEMVQAGRFKKRSASFYHPADASNPKPGVWYPRHVAFLGAQPPAVKGLKDIEFSEAADAVNFSDPVEPQEPTPMDEETKKKLAEAEEAAAKAKAERDAALKRATDAEAQAANFAEKARADRKAQFVSFAEDQLHAGILTSPEDRAMAVASLVALDAAAPVEFSEGETTRKASLVQWLQGLISSATPKVQFGEMAVGKLPAAGGGAKGKSDAEIDQAARAYAAQHKVSYAEALGAVTSFTA
ncbi:MAG: hypothetical protein QM788_05345 [Roseateles sp.]|uniref:hypothetical protein n=1 Tax=Roseateles sp. TaxID=1971397 RepID=UPI0039EAB194